MKKFLALLMAALMLLSVSALALAEDEAGFDEFDLALRVPGVPENDVIQIFGIYPWLETLLPQLILSIILLVTFLMAHYRGKMDALKAQYTK